MQPLQGTGRIQYQGHCGTVKFEGPVDGFKGIWLGVEWDDPSRGKHDGSKDGKRYFSTRHPTAGSFIRLSSNVKYGISFLKALSEKYIEQLHGDDGQETVILGSSAGSIQVEAVGLDKVRSKLSNLARLKLVSLDGTPVAYADPPGEIRDTCPNIRGLDLSLTLIPSWKVVAEITAELQFLSQLSLNHIRFLPFEDGEIPSSSFTSLSEIQLNGTRMPWEDIQRVISLMPQLDKLEVGYNNLNSLSPGASHPCLRTLNLDNNELSDWENLAVSLSAFPSLETLILSSNKFVAIPEPATLSFLSTIKNVSISSNALSKWEDIECLSRWCPKLQSLSTQGVPITMQSHSRSLTIARFPALQKLDGAVISDRERRDAELFYLTHFARAGVDESTDPASLPFRWEELCAIHGPPQKESKPKEEKLSANLIHINLGEVRDPPSTKEIALINQEGVDVLPTMLLRNLRNKIKKKHRKTRGIVSLWMEMRDGKWAELKQDNDANTLDWVGLENGTNIVYCLK